MSIIENDFVKLWIKDGIMYGEYKSVTIDLAAAKIVASDRLKLADNTTYPFLGYIGGMKSVTKEARDFFSHDDGIRYMKKLALLTNSPISKMLGNFFLQISKPTVPTRVFTSEDDSIKWLREDI